MNPWSLPSWFSLLVLTGLAVFLWLRRPPAALWPSVLLCNVFSLAWVAGDLATSFSTEIWHEELAVAVLFTGSIGTTISWWVVAVAYVRSQGLGYRWLRGPLARVPVGLGVALWLLMITNHWHGQFVVPVIDGRNVPHWGALLALYVCYPIVAGSSLLFFALSRVAATRGQRENARILAVATLLPLTTSAAYAFGPWQVPLDFAAVGLGAGGVAVAYGIFRNRLFSLLPVALPEVIRHDPTAVLLVDADGRLMFWNDSVRRTFPDLPLVHDLELYPSLARRLRHPGDDKAVQDALGLERALHAPDQPEAGHLFQCRISDADDRWLRIATTPIPSRRGEVVAHALRVFDVTAQRRGELQRRALEAQLQHVEKLRSLGVLAGGVAHDFNNRLTVILGNASLALQDLSPGDPIHESFEEIEEVAQNAAELTRQLLAYSGRAQFASESVDLSERVLEMRAALATATSPKVSIELRTDPELPRIEGDPIQLQRVLLSLVVNASEAMGVHSGRIAIQTGLVDHRPSPSHRDPYGQQIPAGHYVFLEVSDDGCGMDEDTRRRIFDPFFSKKFNGRGLGLAAAFGIARAHGGGILVESEIGRGTNLRVLFPVPESAADHALPVAAATRPSGRSPTGTILVVDDEEPLRRVAGSILRRAGFDVIVADGGASAIDTFRTHGDEIDLVLLDLSMPEVDGEQVLRELRQLDDSVPVLLSSACDENPARRRSALGFVQKPYSADELVDRVLETLGF